MGDWLSILRPSWLMMTILFWIQAAPNRFGVWFAFFCGFLLDLLNDQLFGAYSLALVLVAYIHLFFHRQRSAFSKFQESLLVMVYTLIYLLVLRQINNFLLDPVKN